MEKSINDSLILDLERINWGFEDYNSAKYPLDINSIPWYPATFPAPIPKYLIALLSEAGDIVLDPFGGKGTTAVEALKQQRRFIYNDLNPHAVMIVNCLLDSLNNSISEMNLKDMVQSDKIALLKNNNIDTTSYSGKIPENIIPAIGAATIERVANYGIKEDVIYWYHKSTLNELLDIFDYISQYTGSENSIRKLAFISILKEVSSQRGHFSYVTDNCKPLEMKYYSAFEAYMDMLERIILASLDFKRQYEILNKNNDLAKVVNQSYVVSGNAKKMNTIHDSSVDLVLTSPPYLCAQDYVLTMRLNDFFFPNQGFLDLPVKEIGPRKLRRKPTIVEDYFSDMGSVTDEIYRVLKTGCYYVLVIGQGKGKVTTGIDVIERVISDTIEKGFKKIFQRTRTISYRTNRIGGVDKEDIIIFQK